DSGLDRAHRPAPAQVSATARPLRLEPVQSRRLAAPAVVRLPRSVLLDRSALSTSACAGSHRFNWPEPGLVCCHGHIVLATPVAMRVKGVPKTKARWTFS